MKNCTIILASQSPSRLKLLESIDILPDEIIATNVNETPERKELPVKLACRLAALKCNSVVVNREGNVLVIAADNVACRGRIILDKASSREHIRKYLNLSSGRTIRVISAFHINLYQGSNLVFGKTKYVANILKFKRLSEDEIEEYVTKYGDLLLNKSGAIAIDSISSQYIRYMSGSFSAIMGIPLYELSQTIIHLRQYGVFIK